MSRIIKQIHKSQIIKKASEIFNRRDDVVFAYLFGSHAKDTATPQSDIDIAVYLDNEEAAAKKLDIAQALSMAMQEDALDLIILNRAPLTLAIRVLENNIVLIDREPLTRHRFESLTMRKYFDFAYIEKNILEERFIDG